ncbi:MAG: hypothetical protein M0R80_25685 [Proteobacteria bacterium]|jgi:hypothetical protein|nr:hypothetical protein [Pseudomonadota bacterium]
MKKFIAIIVIATLAWTTYLFVNCQYKSPATHPVTQEEEPTVRWWWFTQ